MNYQYEQELAIEAVRRACRLCVDVRNTMVTGAAGEITKHDRSPVTVADFGAQAVVAMTLAQGKGSAASIPMVGEEDAAFLRGDDEPARATREKVTTHVRTQLEHASQDQILDAIDRGRDPGGAAGRRWVLDPIDGTKGFLRGDQYAVALALLEDGEVVVGVLGCPYLPVDPARPEARGCLFSAVRGEGARQLGARADDSSRAIRVTAVEDPRQASFCESVEAAHSAHGRHAKIAQRLGVEAEPVRMDSQCKYAAVGRGQASIYLRLPKSDSYREKIWDHAAGAIIVTEAGGRVTDASGRELDFSLGRTLDQNRGVVATNRLLHDRVIEAVSSTL